MSENPTSPKQKTVRNQRLKSSGSLPKMVIKQKPPMESPPTNKQIAYQPSRFVVAEKLQQITYNPKEVLNQFQNKIEEFDSTTDGEVVNRRTKDVKNLQPAQQRVTQVVNHYYQKPQEFKKRPLRRLENDLMMYREIFVQPKTNALQELKEKEKDFEALFHKGQAKQYDKILNINNNDDDKLHKKKSSDVPKEKNLLGTLTILKEEQQLAQSNYQNQDNIDLKQEIDKVQYMDLTPAPESQTQNFFDQQIQVQPPDLPNASIASPLTPGNGYAPSIPLTHNFKENKSSIRDLLVRAKAGMQAGDIQKEAHLSFYLGMVYESNKNYGEATKFYKKYVACAKLMEDKIGMALGTNRVAINYFNSNNFSKSIEYHKQNLQYSDQENTFAGMYNLGIAFRRRQMYEDSIEYFQQALEWAQKRDEAESQCLSFGQLGVTYYDVKQYEYALDTFQNCYDIARKLKNTKLQLDCLLYITKICSQSSMKNVENTVRILRDAVMCANLLGEKKIGTLCLCNLGIIEGELFYTQSQQANKYDDLEFEEF